MKQVFHRSVNGVTGVGFVTELFDVARNLPSVREFHVDSTYKTNRPGYELFGVQVFSKEVSLC